MFLRLLIMPSANARLLAIVLLFAGLSACSRFQCRTPDNQVYTLYRVGGQDQQLRVHVATFDEPGDEQYNQRTCEEVRDLEQATVERVPGYRYWCEKGYYRE